MIDRAALALALVAAAACNASKDAPRASAKASSPRKIPGLVGFDDDPAGSVPAAFKPAETNGAGTPARWAVVADPGAPSPPHAFGTTVTRNAGQTYNLALHTGPSLEDADIQVMVRAVSGSADQGGGVVFRARGPSDYYIARWNPLESNVRFYVVQNSARSALAKAELKIDATTWHALRVIVDGDTMELFVDDEPQLRLKDRTFPAAGSVGLWTKADAATLFDDFAANPLK